MTTTGLFFPNLTGQQSESWQTHMNKNNMGQRVIDIRNNFFAYTQTQLYFWEPPTHSEELFIEIFIYMFPLVVPFFCRANKSKQKRRLRWKRATNKNSIEREEVGGGGSYSRLSEVDKLKEMKVAILGSVLQRLLYYVVSDLNGLNSLLPASTSHTIGSV